MSKITVVAGILAVVGLSACVQGQGGNGINANCALLGAAGGAALGAVTDNNVAESAIVGGALGAGAGATGYCQ
ncbi:MAG: hypothetical protein KDE03_00975 [Rhodobacteraceae bacterium]|nr:hypothetical protein [Paracoccaceae bacterium]